MDTSHTLASAQLEGHDQAQSPHARLPFLDLFSELQDADEFDFVDHYTELIPYPALTLVEQQIVAVLTAIRNKRDWAAKFRSSPELRAKWRHELKQQMPERNKLRVLRYAFKELAWQAEHEPLAAGPDNVHASDLLIPETLRTRLVQLAAKLEDVPDSKKDWHPNSNDQVLDLVHPSLFPVMYRKTCAFPADQRASSVLESVARAGASGAGVVQAPGETPEPYDSEFLSSQFQWLPAEIQVDDTGKHAHFTSYINNLHPKDHGKLYDVLGEVFAAMLPLFEQTLMRIDCPRPIRICTGPDFWYNKVPVESDESPQDFIGSDDDFGAPQAQAEGDETEDWDYNSRKVNHRNDNLPLFAVDGDASQGVVTADDPMDVDSASSESDQVMTAAEMLDDVGPETESESEDPTYIAPEFEDEFDEYPYEKYMEHTLNEFMQGPIGVTGQREGLTSYGDEAYERVYRPKVPRRFVAPAPVDVPTMSPSSQLAGKRLQVIVKLANIHLTPEKPSYPGGSWHVEGMLNESIIATGLYYYAMDNITESRLHFRTFVQPPTVDHQQHNVFSDIYGFEPNSIGYILCQGKGYVTAQEGRAVVFPNMYQHKVYPFELADKSRPGYRKILAFFLVDPNRYEDVLSSAVVPPQQAEWLSRQLVGDKALSSKLPVELVEMIGDKVAMTLDEAKAVRLELMEERSTNASKANELAYGAEYNLCEH